MIGSVQDNSDDMTSRGRASRGSHRPAAKLSEELIPTIRAEYSAGGVTQHQLSKKYGVSQSNISRAIQGQQWKHTDAGADAVQHPMRMREEGSVLHFMRYAVRLFGADAVADAVSNLMRDAVADAVPHTDAVENPMPMR